MLATDATTAFLLVEPTARDARAIGTEARTLGCRVIAHPNTLHALHAAAVVYGPMIARSSLAGVLGVDVEPDPGQPPGLVLLVAGGGPGDVGAGR